MATVSDRTRDPLAVPPWTKEAREGSKSDQYLAKRFAAASADLKSMALATFLLAFLVTAVTWLLVGILVEHWLVPGGLPDSVRWSWFVVGGAAALVACWKWLLPLVRYRVNYVFAARELERGHPDLHNDLVNAVLVKERSGEAAEAIVKSLRRRAARRLSSIDEEGIVDRTPAVRLAWVLTVLVCGLIVYAALAPKSVLTSAARLAAPWNAMVPPSRVQIERPRLAWRMPGEDGGIAGAADRSVAIVDGKAELVRGRQLQVAAVIDGLEEDERPVLLVTPLREDGTPDASLAPWRIAMVAGSGGTHTALVPGPDRGLDSSIELHIAAGDGRSDRIRVQVVDAPSLLVRELRYDYPEYMARESESLPWQGDIRAIEGTRVTVVAEANRPLEVAAIDLGCDGRRNVSLALDKPKATAGKASFVLEFNAERTGPKFSSYRFLYRPKANTGRETEPDVTSPLEHRIEVTPDLAPEVVIEVPDEKVLRVPPDAPVTVRVQAMDPDFGLAKVHVETRCDGTEIRQGDELLVGRPRLSFHGAATLVPQALGGKPGSKLEYRAVAIDTRPEPPNRTVTEWQVLEIDASAPPQEQPPKEGDDDQEGDQGTPQDQGQGNQKGQGEQGKGEPGDGKGDAGGDQKGEGKGEGQDAQGAGDQGQGNQGEGQAEEGQGQQGEGQQGEGQQGEGQQGEGQQGEGQQGEGKQGEGKQGEGKQGEGKQGEGKQGEGKQGQAAGDRGQGQKGDGKQGDGAQGQGQDHQQGEGEQAQGKQGAGQQQGQGEPGQGRGEQRQGEQQGQGSDEGQPSASKPVASDGTDDGEAIERILENRREQGEGQPQNRGGKSDSEASEGGQEQGEGQGREPNGRPQQGQGEQGEGEQGEGQPGAGQGQADQGQGEPQPGQGDAGAQSQSQSGEGQDGQGQRGEAKQGEGKQGEGQAESDPTGEGQQSGSEQSGQGQGQAGEGQEPQHGEGSQGQQGKGPQEGGQQGQGKSDQSGEKGEGQQGQSAGQRSEGAGEGSQPGGQSDQAGESPSAGEGEGRGGQGGRGDASDGRGGQGEAKPLERREMQWTAQDVEHARNAANLAIEHLRDSLAKGRTDVLDDLGWTPEQARAFLQRWQQMQQRAEQGDPRERAEFEAAVRSLGLRPDGVQSSRTVPTDRKGGQAEGRRSRPPSDYREQFKAFMRGASVE